MRSLTRCRARRLPIQLQRIPRMTLSCQTMSDPLFGYVRSKSKKSTTMRKNTGTWPTRSLKNCAKLQARTSNTRN